MFKKILTLSAVAVCLTAALLIAYHFTNEQHHVSRVNNFISAECERYDIHFGPQKQKSPPHAIRPKPMTVPVQIK